MADAIRFVLVGFSMIMLAAAVIVAIVQTARHRGTPEGRFSEQLFRWVALLACGIVGLYTAGCHVFFPESTAKNIGWATSPFQWEVGMADLTVGVLGVMAFRASAGFRLAATVAAITWFGGDAVGHVRQIITAGNFTPGNAGPWLWSDILVPLLMVVAYRATYARRKSRASAGALRAT